jgi:hypothetical protein
MLGQALEPSDIVAHVEVLVATRPILSNSQTSYWYRMGYPRNVGNPELLKNMTIVKRPGTVFRAW